MAAGQSILSQVQSMKPEIVVLRDYVITSEMLPALLNCVLAIIITVCYIIQVSRDIVCVHLFYSLLGCSAFEYLGSIKGSVIC